MEASSIYYYECRGGANYPNRHRGYARRLTTTLACLVNLTLEKDTNGKEELLRIAETQHFLSAACDLIDDLDQQHP